MLFAILVVFIICVGPFQVTKLFEFYRDDTSESVRARKPSLYKKFPFELLYIVWFVNTY